MTTNGIHEVLLDATVRKLSAEGYSVVVEPEQSILPPILQGFRPDAVAIGKEPKLIVEIATESQASAARVKSLQESLKKISGWKLHLVLSRVGREDLLAAVSDNRIARTLNKAVEVADIEPQAGLLLCWAAFEALSRARRPSEFSRPQSPGRIIDRFSARGIISSHEASFLRKLANMRNAIIHGDLVHGVSKRDVTRFSDLTRKLMDSVNLVAGTEETERDSSLWERIEGAGKFELYADRRGEYRYRLKSANGEIILVSEGYKQRSSAENAIESVKKNASIARRYDRKEAKSGEYFFNLKASNGQVIGTSNFYRASEARDRAIEAMMNSARIAPISILAG
nr:DUF1508 domain-containing protein [uncultured Celeribacter sp.]